MKTTFFALAIAAAPFATAIADTDGQITLPYSQFARLTTRPAPAPEPPPQPPVQAALTRADYLVTISADGRARVDVEWQAENFSDAWAWVAVAPLDLAIEPGAESALVANQGEIGLMMATPGIHRATATFPATSSLGVAARFRVVPGSFTSIRVMGEGPADTWQIDGASSFIDAEGQVRHLLPATQTEVVVRQAETQPDPQDPETWNVTAEAWVTYDAGWLGHEVRLTATPVGRNDSAMRLEFPDMPSRIDIASDGLAGHEAVTDSLLIHWESRTAREKTITLRYRTQVSDDHAQWHPRLPETNGSTVVLAIPQGAEISGEGWLPDPAPARLPAWLREKSHAQPVILHTGDPVPVRVKWLPRVETDAMTIAEATISTRVVADGSQLTTAVYQVVHTGPGAARWALPENVTLLNASVSGQRANPVDHGDALEFVLPAPANDGNPTPIQFSFTGTGPSLDPVAGALVVESPSTALFAHRIDWNITLPDGNRLEAVQSNAETMPTATDALPGAVSLRRLLTRSEPLRAEVAYRSLNDPQEPDAWSITAEAWVTYDAGWLDHEVRLTAMPPGRNGSAMRLEFPQMPSRIEVASEDLAAHEQTADGLLLEWKTRATRERTITLRYRTQVAGDHTQWQPRLPQASGSTVVLAIPQGAEISGGGWLADPAPARLPAWLRELSHTQPVLLHSGAPLPADVKWLPRVETDSITIVEASISTRVVADGSQLTTAVYQIAHAAPGTARWSLPENMALLNATVSGQRATPVDRGDALEFVLPAPTKGNHPTVVEFSYTGTGPALDRVAGGLVVESPSTPLFAHRINWNIVLPDGNRLDAVESNAEAAPAPANAPPGAAFLRRLLTRGEPLRAEVFYRSLNSEG